MIKVFISNQKAIPEEDMKEIIGVLDTMYKEYEIIPAAERKPNKPLVELGENIKLLQMADVYVRNENDYSDDAIIEDYIVKLYQIEVICVRVREGAYREWGYW